MPRLRIRAALLIVSMSFGPSEFEAAQKISLTKLEKSICPRNEFRNILVQMNVHLHEQIADFNFNTFWPPCHEMICFINQIQI